MTVIRAFGFAIGGVGTMVSDGMNDAASKAVAYITQREEDVGTVVFLRHIEDGTPFFWDNIAFRYFGWEDDCATAGDGVIADNIPLQSL